MLKAQRRVFRDDPTALAAARQHVRQQYEEKKAETDPHLIQSLLEFSLDCKQQLEMLVVQGEITNNNGLRLRLTEKTFKTKNNEDSGPLDPRIKSRTTSGEPRQCCRE